VSTVVPAASSDRVFAGIALTSIAYALFSGQDAAIKLVVEAIPVWQVLFVRSVTILVGCALIGGPKLFSDTARSPIVSAMLLRSVIILGAWLSYYTAARDLQLAEMITIYFAAPVIVTVLSVLLLGETVPLARWVAVIVGFVGVFIACDPSNLGLSLPILLVLLAAFLWALSIVLLRKIALNERTIIQVVLNNAFFLVVAGVPLFWLWKTPDLVQVLLMVLVGVLGGLAQFTLFEGMKRAQASIVAPFEYTSLVWSFALGYLIWADIPRPAVIAGASLIVLAGVIMVITERRRRRLPPTPPS
jgi:drug/metabolite transporter (DMT)-like permease